MFRKFCFVALFVFTSPLSVNADMVIVDNFSESGGGAYGLRTSFFGQTSSAIAQQFNTGGMDIQLGTVSVSIIRDTTVADFTAVLWSSTASNQPDVAISNLSLVNFPIAGASDIYTFRPDSPTLLDGQTDYFFSVENNVGSNSLISGSVFSSNNYVGPGNILEQVSRSNDGGTTWATAGSNAVLFSVTAVPEPSSLVLFACTSIAMCCRRNRSLKR